MADSRFPQPLLNSTHLAAVPTAGESHHRTGAEIPNEVFGSRLGLRQILKPVYGLLQIGCRTDPLGKCAPVHLE
jgi:hypothetical protein